VTLTGHSCAAAANWLPPPSRSRITKQCWRTRRSRPSSLPRDAQTQGHRPGRAASRQACLLRGAHRQHHRDAREIALAAKSARRQIFQAGLQMRSDPQRLFCIRSSALARLGAWIMCRAQWHHKQSWRTTQPDAEQEKALNWRLSRATSLGLVGELGSIRSIRPGGFSTRTRFPLPASARS